MIFYLGENVLPNYDERDIIISNHSHIKRTTYLT